MFLSLRLFDSSSSEGDEGLMKVQCQVHNPNPYNKLELTCVMNKANASLVYDHTLTLVDLTTERAQRKTVPKMF